MLLSFCGTYMFFKFQYNIVCLLLIIGSSYYSQSLTNNYRTKTLYVSDNKLQIDSVSVLADHVVVTYQNGDTLKIDRYSIDGSNAMFTPFVPINDTLIFEYRILYFDFNKVFQLRDSNIMIQDESVQFKPIRFSALPENRDLLGMKGLNKSGSISRGAFFGNNQNLSLNSNLNLQLAGKISQDIEILASITDDNIPIQPQGNTQQLQDFDQVYIQLFSDDWKLIAGDFWIKKPKGYFLNYQKRGQGATYEFSKQNNEGVFKTQFSAAISKGKFARNVIQGIEGNQGPYRLTGEENEPFIIILSGTERVYIDGKQLQRGQQYDYVIDYNTSELTFTTNHLITKDKRIVVEFQYSDKNYARSLLQNSNEYSKNNWSYFLNVYAEQDSKNQSLQQELDQVDRDLLSSVGDQLDSAIAPSIDSVEFNNEMTLYKKIDSLGYEVYVYSNSSDSAFYQLVFSSVGQGNGDYILSDYNAFGRVYQWTAPDTVNGNIIHNGSYAPIRMLITPKKRQMVTAGVEKKYGNKSFSKIELALSNEDLNTFSSIDNNNNLGYAGRWTWKHNVKSKNKWDISTTLDMEGISKDFRRVERFREVEFERNWNIQYQDVSGNQYTGIGKINLLKNKKDKISYQFNTYHIDTAYSGYKNDLKINWSEWINADVDASYLVSNGIRETSFLRHQSNIFKSFNSIRIGFEDIHEENIFIIQDTLNTNSYRFYDWKVYLQQGDSSKNNFKLFYQERYDWFKNEQNLKRATYARSPGINFSLLNNPKHRFQAGATYRMLSILDTSLTNIQPENSITSRVDYQLRILKGMINSKTYYEIGSGLELRKEFVYFEVPAGQGVYTWIDYNDDGVKDLNEFEIAQYQDQASYIRIFTPSNTYIKVYSYQLSQVLNINPRYYFKSKSKLAKFINRFNSQTALRSEKKTSSLDLNDFINPFSNNLSDTLLQGITNSFRNSLFFNRSNPKFGLEYTFQDYRNKLLLLNGFDTRSRSFNEIKLRWNITRLISVLINTEQGIKTNQSDYAPSRNYEIAIEKIESKLSYQPNTKFRISINTSYSEKINSPESGTEQAYLTDLGLDLRYNQVKKGSFSANIKYIYIKFNGQTNTSIAFEMLESLQPGNNATWTISYQRTLANNLQLTFNYNGRKSYETSTIHSGGVQIRAFF